MSYVTVFWSMAAAGALLLGAVHGLVWVFDRKALANLAFSIVALSVVGIARAEIGMMHAQSPMEWGEWVRWCHAPIFFAITGTVLFVGLYLETGRAWLAWSIIGARSVILLKNFAGSSSSFNFESVLSIERVPFLGEEISVVGSASTGSWQWLATASGIAFLLFVLDAMVRLWRRGGSDDKRKAAIVGGGIVAFLAISVVHTQLVIWGLVRSPILIALPFVVMLGAMAVELSRDVLRAPRLARDLSESDNRLELAASAGGLGLWVWDSTRNEIWATEQARALFGFSSADPIDLDRWLAKVHPDDAAATRQGFEEALVNGREYAAEYRICLSGGHTRWIAARGRSEPGGKGRPLIRGVIRDITCRKLAQADSDELRRELAHAGRVTMLGQLASSLAHELSQPLGAILRNAEAAAMMLDTKSPDLQELREIIADIHSDDRRAGAVIDRLRTLLKRRRMDFQSVAVSGLIQDVISVVRSDAVARHVRLKCAVASGLPTVSGDRVHLSQVLINLIINGMDAIAESKQSRRCVIVAAHLNAESLVHVTVTDSGAGIPPETAEKVFEPFFTTKPGGMGMGLAVSRTIVEAHGGRLWAENNASGGATFHFTLHAAQGAGR